MSGVPARGSGRGGAARGYSWPPFEEGNTASLRHGARSPRVYEPVAEELAAGLLADRPDLEAFPEAVGSWAEAEARAVLLRTHLSRSDVGMFDGDGEPREGMLRWLDRFERRADAMRQRLGLDPRSAAELARERADAGRSQVDLDAVRQRGREALAGSGGEVGGG